MTTWGQINNKTLIKMISYFIKLTSYIFHS